MYDHHSQLNFVRKHAVLVLRMSLQVLRIVSLVLAAIYINVLQKTYKEAHFKSALSLSLSPTFTHIKQAMQSIKAEKDIILKHKRNGELYRALLYDETEKVKIECAEVYEQGLHILTIHDDTVLHAVTYSKQSRLVLDLLEALPPAHLDKMTRQNHQGNTILHEAATSDDNLEVAKEVLEKAPGLLCMRNHLGETALFRSVRYGNKKIFNFLMEKISSYSEDNQQLFLQRSDKTTILHVAILAQHFDLALNIVSKFKHLVGERDADGMTGLQLLSCNPGAFRPDQDCKGGFLKKIINSTRWSRSVEKQKSKYDSALKLAEFLIERDFSWEATYPGIDQSKPRLHKYGGAPRVDKGVGQGPQLMSTALGQGDQPETATPLFLATKSGCVDIAKKILEIYPQAVEHIDDKGRNILHVAIKYRQEKIFQHVKTLELPMKRLRVKSVTPSHFLDHRNNMNLTAEGLFYKANDELRTAATEWLKRTAEGCTVVAVLIATVAFAAAYSVPGGPNSQTGAPLLANKPLFVVFTVTDVLSLSFALTSVVIFLSIVSSPFRLSDFRESLPTKLMLAFTFLFLSVSMMMIAFAATVLLMIQKRESWTKVILYALSFLPVGIFALSYFPLYLSLAETFKYLLKKLRQAMPRNLPNPALSRPTNLFHSYRNRSNQRQIDQNRRLETQNRCCQIA